MAKETQLWLGVPRISIWLKLNPLWWFGNQEGMDGSYMPTWPLWQRQVFWFFRNFMYNFFRFIVGVEDHYLLVTGDAPVFTTFWYECSPPSLGLKTSVIRTLAYPPLPFVSYSGTWVRWYIGWLPSGGRLGAKFNRVPS